VTSHRLRWLATLACSLLLGSTPAHVLAQSGFDVSPDPVFPACGTPPDDSPRLAWEYTSTDTANPRILCTADDLADLLKEAHGNWGVAIRDFATGETLIANADQQFVAGSLYKLGVAAEAYARISDGALSEQSLVAIGPQDIDPVYGGSRYFAGTYLTVHQAIVAMVTASDNGAALAMVDRLGLNAVNHRFELLGMPHTRLVYDAETTPRDLLNYLTLLADGELISPEVSSALMDLMASQQINDRIPAGLPAGEDWWVAHKTGNVDAMLGDAGIVHTRNGSFALVIINEGLVSYQASVSTFRAISQRLYHSFVPLDE
jgi:beta-lactamase class A